jgi:hypothetical protein
MIKISISLQPTLKNYPKPKSNKTKISYHHPKKLPKFNFQKVSIIFISQLNKSVLSNNFNKLRDLTEKNYLPLER